MSNRKHILSKLTILFGILTLLLIITYLFVSINNADLVIRAIIAASLVSSFIMFGILKILPREKQKKKNHNNKIINDSNEEIKLISREGEDNKVVNKITVYRVISIILFVSFLVSLGFNIFGKKREVNLDNLEMNIITSNFTEPKEGDINREIRYEMTIGVYNKNSYDVSLFAENFDLYFYNINSNSIFEEINFPIYFTFANTNSEIKIKTNKYTEVKITSQAFTETAGSVIIGVKALSFFYEDKLIFIAGGF